MFTPDDRQRVSDWIVELARSDERIGAAAFVGGSAQGSSDRWSDIDLTFGIVAPATVGEVLEDWSPRLDRELDAVHLFDLPSGPTVYRVFLLPGCLQVDLSFTDADAFGATGPRFELLFGDAVERAQPTPPQAAELFGIAVHHAVRARICIERGRLWQAEYWLSAVRDHALMLACLRAGLEPSHGRGFDALSDAVRERLAGALVVRVEPAELLRALRVAVDGLLLEVVGLSVAARVADRLRHVLP
jgi:hypothetical protein